MQLPFSLTFIFLMWQIELNKLICMHKDSYNRKRYVAKLKLYT